MNISEPNAKMEVKQDEAVGSERPPSVVERYFEQRFKINVKGKQREDHCVLSHSNRICIVTLAQSHPVVAQKKKVTSVNFKVNDNLDRLDNKVTGKSKRGAQILKANSPLCKITCDDGSEYTVYSCIRGMLVEVNEHLSQKPNLLVNKFQTEGYIAVVLPRLYEFEREMKSLLSHEDYKSKMADRDLETPGDT
ncbi:protein Abitram-like [Haliotis rubra]|uniref:protein Abitram-like n=1 Tax=Haliotis rubra TaxID=36100 RepID=UPI001EE6043F|nr:protein Abitram-like [Haliotis rubra]